MATIHSELPEDRQGHHGEFVVGQILKDFSNPGLELWFDVNYIAGVPDLDLILLDNQVSAHRSNRSRQTLIIGFLWQVFQIYH